MTPIDRQIKIVFFFRRTLQALTVLFVVALVINLWQKWQTRVVDLDPEASTIIKFSEVGQMQAFVSDYAFAANLITDIESVPALRELFFNKSPLVLQNQIASNENLETVLAWREMASQNSDDHVYYSSYSNLNLLILPSKTLYELAFAANKFATLTLLESFLNEVRSGTVKLQNYFDVAPPIYYDPTVGGRVYAVGPSFPSLPAVEAVAAYLLMSEVDTASARLYEIQSHRYLADLLSSGAHWPLDIEYAVRLVEIYFNELKKFPDFANKLASAKGEWSTATLSSSVDIKPIFIPRTLKPQFSYDTNSEMTATGDFGVTATANNNNELLGKLRLSLVDSRLGESLPRLYEYDFKDGSLLPADLVYWSTVKQPAFGVLGGPVFSSDRYLYLQLEESGLLPVSNARLVLKANDTLQPLDLRLAVSTQESVFLSPSGSRVAVLVGQKGDPIAQIHLLRVEGDALKTERIIDGSSPAWGKNDDELWYVKAGRVYRHDLVADTLNPIDIVLRDETTKTELVYLPTKDVLVVAETFLDTVTYRLNNQTSFYRAKEGNRYDLAQTVNMTDHYWQNVTVSDDEQYLAGVVFETLGEHKPRILIFNINSGIIEKEIDLKAFRSSVVKIDDWVKP